MATVTLTYVIHNVPPGDCTAVFNAQGSTGGTIGPVSTTVHVLTSFFAPVVIDPPLMQVSS